MPWLDLAHAGAYGPTGAALAQMSQTLAQAMAQANAPLVQTLQQAMGQNFATLQAMLQQMQGTAASSSSTSAASSSAFNEQMARWMRENMRPRSEKEEDAAEDLLCTHLLCILFERHAVLPAEATGLPDSWVYEVSGHPH